VSIVGGISGQEALGWRTLAVTAPGRRDPGTTRRAPGLLQRAAPRAAGYVHITWQNDDRFASTGVFYLLLVTFSISLFFFSTGLELPPPWPRRRGAGVPPYRCDRARSSGTGPWDASTASSAGAARVMGLAPLSPLKSTEREPAGRLGGAALQKDEQNRSLLTASLLVLSSPSPWPASKWIITFNLPKFPLQIQL